MKHHPRDHPEAVTARHRYVNRKIVSVLTLDTEDRESVRKGGSGAVVKLGGRWFVLTAGHVIDDVTDAGLATICRPLIGAETYESDLTSLNVRQRSGGVCGRERVYDAGVLEIEPKNELAEVELEAIAVPREALAVNVPRSADLWEDAWVTICGYPGEYQVFGPPPIPRIATAYAATTFMAGVSDVPPVPEKVRREGALMDMYGIWLPLEYDADGPPLPDPEGMSGGGIWAEMFQPGQPPRLRYFGTLAKATKEIWAKGPRRYQFVFGAPVSCHLLSMAAADPLMKRVIVTHWPELEESM